MRLIDADEITRYKERLVVNAEKIDVEYRYVVDVRYIDDIPTVDAVPVVRCRECRFNTSEKKCLYPDSIIKVTDDNDYCSYGQRREDGDA